MAEENQRLRTIISDLVEWRDKPWAEAKVNLSGLPDYPGRDLMADIDKARSETEQVWQAAREVIKAAQPK